VRLLGAVDGVLGRVERWPVLATPVKDLGQQRPRCRTVAALELVGLGRIERQVGAVAGQIEVDHVAHAVVAVPVAREIFARDLLELWPGYSGIEDQGQQALAGVAGGWIFFQVVDGKVSGELAALQYLQGDGLAPRCALFSVAVDLDALGVDTAVHGISFGKASTALKPLAALNKVVASSISFFTFSMS